MLIKYIPTHNTRAHFQLTEKNAILNSQFEREEEMRDFSWLTMGRFNIIE